MMAEEPALTLNEVKGKGLPTEAGGAVRDLCLAGRSRAETGSVCCASRLV